MISDIAKQVEMMRRMLGAFSMRDHVLHNRGELENDRKGRNDGLWHLLAEEI